MKKNLKITIVILLIFILIVTIIYLILKNYNDNNKEKEELEEVATIYYSKIKSTDQGTEYLYIIYKDNDKYQYVLTKSTITIDGPVEEKTTFGKIKSKKDLEEINSKYKNYDIIISSNEKELKSLKELEKLLFK
jgi:hypothetical protein